MLYKEQSTNLYLTKEDVSFNKKLYGEDVLLTNCVKIQTIEKQYPALKYIFEKQFKFSTFLKYFSFFILAFAFLIVYLLYNFPLSSFSIKISEETMNIFYVVGIVAAVLYLPLGWLCQEDFKFNRESVKIGSHVESYWDSYTRTMVTKTVDEYDGGAFFEECLLTLTFVFWGLPVYFIRNTLKTRKKKREYNDIPEIIRKTYNEVILETKEYKLDKRTQKKLKIWEKYNKSELEIYELYPNYSNYKQRELLLKELKKPAPILFNINDKNFYIIWVSYDGFFALYKENDIFKGCIINQDRLVYSTTYNYKEDWSQINPHAIEYAEYLINNNLLK